MISYSTSTTINLLWRLLKPSQRILQPKNHDDKQKVFSKIFKCGRTSSMVQTYSEGFFNIKFKLGNYRIGTFTYEHAINVSEVFYQANQDGLASVGGV